MSYTDCFDDLPLKSHYFDYVPDESIFFALLSYLEIFLLEYFLRHLEYLQLLI
uniref:Uncharacterized protein n=1 Tax=Schistosoma curassoni TaxID=6186 RepID=A0A183JIY6_9TREM